MGWPLLAALLLLPSACAGNGEGDRAADASEAEPARETSSEPPTHIREWMDCLTVAHEYDPATGFIVAKEVIDLPEAIAAGPPLREAIDIGQRESRDVIVFATADRCGPCQQYKKSALNDPAVVEALGRPELVVTHVEVDREAEGAEAVLGSRAIPMTYLFRNGERVATLPGQRSAEELLAWLAASKRTPGA